MEFGFKVYTCNFICILIFGISILLFWPDLGFLVFVQLFWLKKFCGRGDVRVDNIFPRDGDGNVRLSPHIWKQTME